MNPICSIPTDVLTLVVEMSKEVRLDIQVLHDMSIQHPVLTVMIIDHAAAPDLVVADTVVALEITQGPVPVREIIIIPVEDLTPEVEEEEAEAHADTAVSALTAADVIDQHLHQYRKRNVIKGRCL